MNIKQPIAKAKTKRKKKTDDNDDDDGFVNEMT